MYNHHAFTFVSWRMTAASALVLLPSTLIILFLFPHVNWSSLYSVLSNVTGLCVPGSRWTHVSFSLFPAIAWTVSSLFLHFLSPLFLSSILNGHCSSVMLWSLMLLLSEITFSGPVPWAHPMPGRWHGLSLSNLAALCAAHLARGQTLWDYLARKDRVWITRFFFVLSTTTSPSLCALGRGVCHQQIVMLVNTNPVITLTCGLWAIFSSLCIERQEELFPSFKKQKIL